MIKNYKLIYQDKTVRFSRDSLLVASGSDDKTLKLWDTFRKKLVYDFKNGDQT